MRVINILICSDTGYKPSATVEYVDWGSPTPTVIRAPDLQQARCEAAAVLVSGRIVVAGGAERSYAPLRRCLPGLLLLNDPCSFTRTFTDTVEVYDGNGWNYLPNPLSEPRSLLAGAVAGGRWVIFAGGVSALGPTYAPMLRDSWHSVTSFVLID